MLQCEKSRTCYRCHEMFYTKTKSHRAICPNCKIKRSNTYSRSKLSIVEIVGRSIACQRTKSP